MGFVTWRVYSFNFFVLIGSKTSCHSSTDAPRQQDKNRSYKDADSSGSSDQWIGFW